MKLNMKNFLIVAASLSGGSVFGQTIHSSCSYNNSRVSGYIENRNSQPVVVTGHFTLRGDFYDYDLGINRSTSDTTHVNQILYRSGRINASINFSYNQDGTGCDISTSGLSVRYLQPPTPVGLGITHASEYSLSVDWRDGNDGELNATHYRVDISKTQSMSSTCSGPNSQNTGLFQQATFSGLEKGTRYYIGVCSFSNNGQFKRSSLLKTATIADPSPEVTGFTAVSEHPNSIVASWMTGGGSTIDFVYTLVQGNLPSATCSGGTVLTATSLRREKLNANTNYSIRVCSRNINESISPGLTSIIKTQDPENIMLPFTDYFTRSNSSTLGLGWELKGGSIGIRNDRASSLYSKTSVATLKNLSPLNVKLKALSERPADFGTKGVGIVARHSFVAGKTNMYVAQIKKKGANSIVSIIAYLNSVGSVVATKTIKGAEGNLEFEVQGSNLKVLLNGTLIHDINDSRISTPGGVGIATFGTGESLRNFIAKP